MFNTNSHFGNSMLDMPTPLRYSEGGFNLVRVFQIPPLKFGVTEIVRSTTALNMEWLAESLLFDIGPVSGRPMLESTNPHHRDGVYLRKSTVS